MLSQKMTVICDVTSEFQFIEVFKVELRISRQADS